MVRLFMYKASILSIVFASGLKLPLAGMRQFDFSRLSIKHQKPIRNREPDNLTLAKLYSQPIPTAIVAALAKRADATPTS